MKTLPGRRRFILTLAALIAGGGLALADDEGAGAFDDDHDAARHAVEQGSVLPLAEILDRTRAALDGDVVGIEFEHQRGRYLYELKVISPSGQLREVEVDAATGEILGSYDD